MEFSQDGLASVAVDLLVFTIEEDRLNLLKIFDEMEALLNMEIKNAEDDIKIIENCQKL